MTTKAEGKRKRRCACPIYCQFCGRHRSLDAIGHYCKTVNCQWQHGYPNCYRRTRP